MQTLSYGFLLPQSGIDKGAPAFTALESNIQRLNDHNHDGVNSALIPSTNIASGRDTILASNWASYSGPIGHYRQLVTILPGFTFDSTTMSFRIQAGPYIYPSIERVSNTSFYIYSIDPTLTVWVVYGG